MIQARLVRYINLVGAVAALLPLSTALSQEHPAGSNRSQYVGDASCLPCHRQLGESYHHTAHHFTSQLPTAASVLGSFHEGSNALTIVDTGQRAEPSLQFIMKAEKNSFSETARTGWGEAFHERSERIDVVTGSGERGQTYLFWQRNQLFELPVSYWTSGNQWINSPGYVDGTADFSRPVYPACLECHATYIRAISSDPATNSYDRSSLIPGISCESCHGPGLNHQRIESEHRSAFKDASDSGIINPGRFPRDRQVDLCGECHNGIQRESLAPAFSYIPGRSLTEYFKPLPSPELAHPDVHGNQVGLLQKSRCYLTSEKMSCSTCHDVHAGRNPAESYSPKCLGCHQWQSCGMARKIGASIVKDCINCHMPIEETNVIVSKTAGKVLRAKMRNHWIKVYPGVESTGGSHPAD